ncbi:hypothetical protein ABTA86_19825, partial [Acinetobacter baumannii]
MDLEPIPESPLRFAQVFQALLPNPDLIGLVPGQGVRLIISCASSKGGVGKSTICAAIGARLAQCG